MIGLLLITLAVPSIAGMLAEQRLKQSFEAFDGFVRSAKMKSVSERRTYVMVWDEEGITMHPAETRETDEPDAGLDRFDFEKDETFTIARPAALMKNPPGEWVFWRSGTCEPALISFKGEAGDWSVQYNPLTVRGQFLDSNIR